MTAGRDVIVIGAGHNGLTAAALLAGNGCRVLVLERRDGVGGLAAGVLHDTSGVSPDVVDALDLRAHGLDLVPPPPVYVPQAGGPGLLLQRDPAQAAAELGPDAERYAEWRSFIERVGGFVRDLFGGGVFEPVRSGLALRRLGRRDMPEVLRVVPMSLADWLGEWFESDLLRAALAAPAIHGTWTGPRSPGSAASLLRLEAGSGAAVRGGPAALIDALVGAARARGVEIHTGVEVRQITVSSGRVAGVTLASGETVETQVVASSCDPRRTFLDLLAPRDLSPRLEDRIRAYRMRGTTAVVNLDLAAPLRFAARPDLVVEHARIGERLDDLEHAFDAVKYRRFSDRPILDVHVSPARGVAVVLVHFVPYELEDGWDDEQRQRLGRVAMSAIEEHAPGATGSAAVREVLAPPDIERRYGVTGGHIHHGEHGLDQLLVRPCPECGRYATPIEGLYLCGGGTPPGGGLTCAPGAAAAAIIGRE